MATAQTAGRQIFPTSEHGALDARAGMQATNTGVTEVQGVVRLPRNGISTAEAVLRGLQRSKPSVLPASSLELRLLIIDSDAAVLQALAEAGRQMGFAVQAEAPTHASDALKGTSVDVVLLELSPNPTSMELLRTVRRTYPRVPIIVTTAFSTVGTAVEALRQGATDYLAKPFSLEELSATLTTAAQRRTFDVEARRVQQQMRTDAALQRVVAVSPAMQKLMAIVSRVAGSNHPVLVFGESGTGKEHIARMLHHAGRAPAPGVAAVDDAGGGDEAAPFLPVSCNTTAAALLETQLFGYVRNEGGPEREEQVGLLTREGGGTLFLDDVEGLPVDLQVKLLRALQERGVRPPGGAVVRPLTVRVLAGSSADLAALVERGMFRKDLYFRMNVVNLRVPPLRQRREDLPLLAAIFLERCSRERGMSFTLSSDALRVLLGYEWPGNVRELEAAMERACTLSSGPVLALVDLPSQLQNLAHEQTDAESARFQPSARTVLVSDEEIHSIAELERRAIVNTLKKLNGDKLGAARLLGIGKTTLYRKLKEYGIAEI